MRIFEYDQKKSICLSCFAKWTNAAAYAILVAADMQMFRVDAGMLLAQKRSSHIATFSCLQLL